MDTTPEPQPLPASKGAPPMEVIVPSSREGIETAMVHWRQIVCKADPTPESAEVAAFLADMASGHRSPGERLSVACGLTIEETWKFVDELIALSLLAIHPDDEEDPDALPSFFRFPADELGPSTDEDMFIPIGSFRGPERPGSLSLTSASRRIQETVLYHYYDAQGVLLYIGITNSLPRRQAAHEGRSTWMDFAARSTMKHFPTRESAEAVELVSIRRKAPLFNIEHNDRPDRVRRIVDYLIDRDRRDLLVPLISRG